MLAGADAYATNPTDPVRLYHQMLQAASSLANRIEQLEKGMEGSISIRCKCGKSLSTGLKHARRAVICPSCKHLAKALDAGTLHRTMMGESQGIRSSHIGVECSHCHKIVDDCITPKGLWAVGSNLPTLVRSRDRGHF